MLWIRQFFASQATRELAELYVQDYLDDVDCSGSTLVYRNQRAGELIDYDGANEQLASYIAQRIIDKATHFCSGAPISEEVA
jgi:hypothetical protein